MFGRFIIYAYLVRFLLYPRLQQSRPPLSPSTTLLTPKEILIFLRTSAVCFESNDEGETFSIAQYR